MFGTQEQINNGPWLVKSGDRVLGPYTTDEVAKLLRSKEIVVIDEVMSPQGRWAYIRDVQSFHPVVEEIRRGQMQAREDTEIQGYTNTVIGPTTNVSTTHINDMPDHTVTEVEKAKAPQTSGAAGNPASKNPTSKTPSPQPASPAANVQPQTPVPPKPVMTPKEKKPERQSDIRQLSIETPADPTYNMRPRQRKAPGLLIGGLVLLFAAVFVVYTVSKKTTPTTGAATTVSTENLETQASVAWKRGEFERALELYKAIDRQSPNQPLVVARLALLMMQLEGQTVEAKRMLQSVSENIKDVEASSQVQIALGLAALHNEDAKEAISRFSAAGSSWIASFNTGVAHASLKDWNAAVRSFGEAGAQPIATYMLAKVQLSEAEAMSKPALRKDAESTITKGLSRFADFHQELLVLGAYSDLLSGNKKRAEARALQAVEVDPEQTPDHFHDPALSLEAASWAQLVPMCRSIDSALESSVSAALMGICLAKSNQLEDAAKAIDAKLSLDTGNPYLHSANAYLHMTADRDDAARASLTLASKSASSRLTQILSARLCVRERQDACAEEGWSKLASEKDPPLAAYTGLAQIKFQKGDTPTGNALLVNAEKISPTYLPLLRLREDASR
jgi:tetratricopeptide (TPR) repeat protein